MDFHAIRGEQSVHLMTTHRGDADNTPLQMISVARLEYYQTLERALLSFIESIASVLPAAPPSEVETSFEQADAPAST